MSEDVLNVFNLCVFFSQCGLMDLELFESSLITLSSLTGNNGIFSKILNVFGANVLMCSYFGIVIAHMNVSDQHNDCLKRCSHLLIISE